MSYTVRVWDLPTRLFHWSLLACIIGSAITGSIGGSVMPWHARCGYAVLSLLLFRIVWGLVGGRWSRFASFMYSPASVVNYLRGRPHPDHLIGHNPLGAGSVFAMLAFLGAQVATGLIGDDEIAFTGPLNKFVSSANGLLATSYHKQVGKWVLLALIALHVSTVLYYLWKKKDNLIGPMIHGDKQTSRAVASSRDDARSRFAAAVTFGLCVALVRWIVQLGA